MPAPPPEPPNGASPLRTQGWGWSRQARVIFGSLLVLSLSLLVLHILPPAWAADPSPSPRGGMMGGRRMGPGMMWGGGMCPMGGPLPSAPFPASQLPEPDSKGAVLFKSYCVQCHSLPSPPSHTPTHWENAFSVMLARMRMMAYHHQTPWGQWMPNVKAPSDTEAEEILAYLKRHGLRPAPENIAPESAGPGAALFRSTCATCHALPNPALHTSAEWPAVITRMRAHMRSSLKTDIEDRAADQISAFLAQAGKG